MSFNLLASFYKITQKGGIRVNNSLSVRSVVVGVDTHKYSHTAVAMNIMGKEIGYLEFDNEKLDSCISWLESLGNKRDLVIGLENIHGYGFHLARNLSLNNFNIRYVPPILTKREKKYSIHKEKTDYIDAKQVGKVILNKIEDTLNAEPIITKEQQNLRLIDLHIQERESLVKQQTEIKNRLHNLLHQYYGNNYKQKFKDIFANKALKWYEKDINNLNNNLEYLASSILRLIEHLKMIKIYFKKIDEALENLGKNIRFISILKKKLFGCGWLTACKIMVEIKDIDHFVNQNKLARYGGFSPVKLESGSCGRLITDKYGNRKLNKAVHTIALGQISRYGPEKYKSYYKKKLNEGKSKLWALRCLKRQIIKNIFIILKEVA